jgi:glycosyltransferase involved in cell wall biosynthesis
VRRWVYYCVDDFSRWPGLDQAVLDRMERKLVAKVDDVIAVSETLRERLAGMGRRSHLLTHGVDLDFWARPGAGLPPPALAGLERPLVVFWGLTDRRLDVAFLARLAGDLDRGTVVLVGPRADPDPALRGLKRVAFVPPLEFGQLPGVAREAAVLVMPYADLPVTRAMQPLKLKEYLATGRPAVVRDLPANRPWADCLDLVQTPEAFSRAVRLRLSSGLPEAQRAARARLRGEGWGAKADALEQILAGETSSYAALSA